MTKSDKIILTASIITAFFLLLLLSVLHDVPLRDVAHRYAPMSEALASGNFFYAFHPRVLPLHTIFSAAVAFLTGFDGFTACKFTSCFWYFAGMFILYKLMQTIYPEDKKIQVLSVALYAIFPYTSQMAYCGLREPIKTFVFLLAALSLVRIKSDSKNVYNYILLGIAAGFSCIVRSDMIPSACFFLVAGAYFECQNRKFPIMSILSCIISQALIIPNICINYSLFSLAAPDFRFSALFSNYIGKTPDICSCLLIFAAANIFILQTGWAAEKITRKIKVKYLIFSIAAFTVISSIAAAAKIKFDYSTVINFLESVSEGFHSFFGLIVFVYLVIRSKKRKLNSVELILITLVTVNAFVNIVSIQLYYKQLYVSSRYLHPVLPLLFGFFVCALRDLYVFIRENYSPKWAKVFLACIVVYITGEMIFHTCQPVIRSYTRKKNIVQRKKVLQISKMIKADYSKCQNDSAWKFEFDPETYIGYKRPMIYMQGDNKVSAAAYLAGGSLTFCREKADYIITIGNNEQFRKNLKLVGSVEGYRKTVKLWRVEK